MTVFVGRDPVLLTRPALAVRAATTPSEFAAVLALRLQVFTREQGIVGGVDPDPEDARSLHALVTVDGLAGDPEPLPVGTGRLTLRMGDQGEALIAWVATRREWRDQGIGAAVMRFLLAAATEANAPAVHLAAQARAIPFYRRLGFVPFGDPFIAGGVRHQAMIWRPPRR